jgi:hypothetical protein
MIKAIFALNDTSHLQTLTQKHHLVMTGASKGITYLQDMFGSAEQAYAVLLELRAQGIPLAITKTEEIPL